MLKEKLAVVALLPVALSAPQTAKADVKDALIGGVVGAVVTEAIRNSQQSQRQRAQTVTRPTVPRPATLNSTYTVAERKQIQGSLNALGFSVGTVDGILGRNSRNAISQFQATLGQPVTGQLTRAQFAMLTGTGAMQPQLANNRNLQPQELMLLQQSLFMLGHYRGGVDGIAGPGTQQAAANFRAQQGPAGAGMTEVQTVVLAAQRAGLQAPPYLMQEAQTTIATAPFGAAPQNPLGNPAQPGVAPQQAFGVQTQPGFGAQPQNAFGAQSQPGFGTQPQPGFGAQPQQAFGAPTQPVPGTGFSTQQPGAHAFGTPPQGQHGLTTGAPAPTGQTPLFGTPTQATGVPQQGLQQMPQQAAPQAEQQPLFAPQQQAPGVVPQQQAPLQQQPTPVPQTQGQSLFAAGTFAPQPQPAPVQQQGGLDIYSPAPTVGTEVAGGVPTPTFGATQAQVPNTAAFATTGN